MDTLNEQQSTFEPTSRLELPPAPVDEAGPVKAWHEPVSMRSYLPAPPDANPLFLEKRVYQGSSGRVYPLPVIDSIATVPRDHLWQAVHIENEYLRLMVLPEIGGRVHVGLDKRNGYDFFYRQNVVKPALVGLAGPWLSGGVEFNWPQHHRPATFMPVESSIERDVDGSVTIWCSDHEPMTRMKGMHGICLRPGVAYVEVRVRLYNRTLDTQTFLWWANVATHVHERYQSFFPEDVQQAADHAKRAVTEYPLSQGLYYGVDYGDRARNGVPEDDAPACFVPDGSYAPNDLGWYANIPVPTSYMIAGSRGDYFGGYDHRRDAGTVAVANHHISPGKKQWTWGNHEFGYAWDRSLTDHDGPYVELMSGVYTDNQPDFSFLARGETKTFSQFWYPIQEIGVPSTATVDAAMRVEALPAGVRIHLQVTQERLRSTLRAHSGGQEVGVWSGDLRPETPLHHDFEAHILSGPLEVVLEQDGNTLLRYAPAEIGVAEAPVVATEPRLPEDVVTLEELFLIGVHLEQYRHPTRMPEGYWREALRRDSGDSRSNASLGRWHLRRGEFADAEYYLRAAIARLTSLNPNPPDGGAFYNLGVTLHYQGRIAEAYDALYKSTWNAAWRGPAYHRLAEIDCSRCAWAMALEHLDRSLRAESDNLNARNLKAMVLRVLGRHEEATALLEATRCLDALDIWSRFLLTGQTPAFGQQRLDLAFDLRRAGFTDDALRVLAGEDATADDGSRTILLYARADALKALGRTEESTMMYRQAADGDPYCVFPSRLEEMILLEAAIAENPNDARAPYYLENLLYDRRRHAEAIAKWEESVRLDPEFPTTWRNIAFGYYNVLHDRVRALDAFERARACSPRDARILYEQDQLLKLTGEKLETRLATLEENDALVAKRDDLTLELAALYNSTGQAETALNLLLSHTFQPWEGGEGLVLGQYVRSRVLLAQRALGQDDAELAVAHLHAAWKPPTNLSEARHLLTDFCVIDYWLGVAHQKRGSQKDADTYWNRAAGTHKNRQATVQNLSEMTFWKAKALVSLGHEEDARVLLESLRDYALHLREQTPAIDYFATSLPAMLLFDKDLYEQQTIASLFLEAQACLGLNEESKGLGLLEKVLALDRSNNGAIDLLGMQRTS